MCGKWDGEGWKRKEEDFCKKIKLEEVDNEDLIKRIQGKKEVKIEEGTRAILIHDGEFVSEIGPGRHTLESHWKKIKNLRRERDLTVVLVDVSPKSVEFQFEKLRSESEFEFSAILEFDIQAEDLEKFYKTVAYKMDDAEVKNIGEEVYNPLKNILEHVFKQYGYDDIYGNERLQEQVQRNVKQKLADILEENGLSLVRLRSFDYDDDLEEIRSKKRRKKKDLLSEEVDVDTEEEREGLRERVSEVEKKKAERRSDEQVKKIEEKKKVGKKEEKANREVSRESQKTKHKLEEEQVGHEENIKKERKESSAERRDIEWEQDKKEISEALDLKKKLDSAKNKKEREKIKNRNEATVETLASMESTEDMSELAKMEKAKDLDSDQLEALGAEKSDELAKARQKAHRSESDERLLDERKEMQDEMKEVMESAMDNMSETAQKASEQKSDNVIVDGSSGGENTTIVNDSGNSDNKEE